MFNILALANIMILRGSFILPSFFFQVGAWCHSGTVPDLGDKIRKIEVSATAHSTLRPHPEFPNLRPTPSTVRFHEIFCSYAHDCTVVNMVGKHVRYMDLAGRTVLSAFTSWL